MRHPPSRCTAPDPSDRRPRRRFRVGPAFATIVLASSLALVPGRTQAQEDSVTVVAGSRYEELNGLGFVLGTQYRDVWTAPIRVPVLRPDTFAGGLTLLQRGGGLQTVSLRFGSPDGREYVFRSVDKNQSGGLHEDLRRTLVSAIAQDQVSSKHPAAALVVAPLLTAAGVPAPQPRFAVMADHPLLGEHREEFAGMLGMIEERPEAPDEGTGFNGYPRVIGSERLLERLEDSPVDRADARAYLRARLMDLLVGDWDRHADQWRWGETDRDGTRVWIAIPRDRDNAFSDFDGLVGRAGAAVRPNVQRFEPRYSNLYGLVHNAQVLDRWILPELSLAAWDSVASDIRSRITDRVIADAVGHMPPPHVRLSGAALEARLRARRDALPEVAREFYALLATEVDVRATDEDDRAEVVRRPDGSLDVRLRPASGDGDPYFERRFLPSETREVRLYLHGGDDLAEVRGAGSPITVRVIGGGGDDTLVDRSEPRAAERTIFHDHRGSNRFTTTSATRVDTRDYDAPDTGSAAENNAPPARDWGSASSRFQPRAEWRTQLGPVVGGGPSRVRHGFRRHPFAQRTRVSALLAPLHLRMGIEGEFVRVHTGDTGESRVAVRATQLVVTDFHGYGNETARIADDAVSRIWAEEIALAAEITRRIGPGTSISAGPALSYLWPSVPVGSVRDLAGGQAYGLGGVLAWLVNDRRERSAVPRRGHLVRVDAAAYPFVREGLVEPFVRMSATGVAYLPLPGAWEPTLAMRLAATGVSEGAPLQQAAFLGGGSSLRGYDTQRFAGDVALSGSAELRSTLGRVNLLVARGDLGTLGFVDAGRVFQRGESSNRIHSGYGAGAWFATLDRSIAVHAAIGFGESTTLHAGFGLPF
jgi:hypothetical protein